jgi:hypothetical protein
MIQFPLTWAEDKATVGTDLSADPGAKTEWGGTMPPSAIRDWHECAKSQARHFRYESHSPPWSWVRLAVMVSFTGSLAAVLVTCGCTPTHPFVNTSALRRTLRSL